MVVLMLDAWSRRTPHSPTLSSHGIAELVQCPLPTKRWCGQDKRPFQTLPIVQYNMASHYCPYQSGVRKPSRPNPVIDLEAAPLEPGSLLGCRFSRFVALWLCGFVALWPCRFGVGGACQLSVGRNLSQLDCRTTGSNLCRQPEF